MSAWTVTSHHIDALLSAALAYDNESGGRFSYYHRGQHHELTADNANEVGRMLWRENYRSVNYRYGERTRTPAYSATLIHGRPDPGAVYKLATCYEYQSCEHPRWERSEAAAFVETLVARVTIVAMNERSAYHDTPWGVDLRAQVHGIMAGAAQVRV